jgi:hypothetical protein
MALLACVFHPPSLPMIVIFRRLMVAMLLIHPRKNGA